MIICTTISSLQTTLQQLKKQGKEIGFVPTMGALHNGHISLIQQSKSYQYTTVCSIFVNPTQFNNSADFAKYPKTIEQDILYLEAANCDVLFIPTVDEIYPNGIELNKQYKLGFIETVLEGSSRPGHFQGVCQVVERLLRIVEPHFLFLGKKDYQQCMVITQLVSLMNWTDQLQIVMGETLREPSGLAMSSRNMRLTEEQKLNATAIFSTLQFVQQNISKLSITELIEQSTYFLHQNEFEQIDYVALCNATTLEPIQEFNATIQTVVLIAAFIGGVRLIDNLVLNSQLN